MEPTLPLGGYVFTQRFAYFIAEAKRGDIISFGAESISKIRGSRNQIYIKRVVGFDGDVLSLREKYCSTLFVS